VQVKHIRNQVCPFCTLSNLCAVLSWPSRSEKCDEMSTCLASGGKDVTADSENVELSI
jgi:hypothetical protein